MISCYTPTLGLKTVNVVVDGLKFVLSGVSSVSTLMRSTRPPSENTVRQSRTFSVFSAYTPTVFFWLSAENGATRSPVRAYEKLWLFTCS